MADDRSKEGRVRLTALPHLPLETHSTESSRRRNPSSDQRQEGGERFSERRAEARGPASPHGVLSPLLPGSAPGREHFGVGVGERELYSHAEVPLPS